MIESATISKKVWESSIVRKVQLSWVLFVLAGLMIALGIYVNSRPDWMVKPTIRSYNQGVTAYHLPPGLLPASDERPSEWGIERARAYFEIAASEKTNTKLRAVTLYNLGTLIAREAYASNLGHSLLDSPRVDMTEAVLMLQESVRLDPDNENAKYNLEVLEQVLSIEGEKEGAAGPGYSKGSVEKGY